MTTRRMVVWRHGQTAWNARGMAQGQTDVPLDEMGVEQARNAAARLASLRPVYIRTSDLSRAVATANELAALTGLDPITDSRLREMHMGARQGLSLSRAFELFPEQMQAWREGRDVALPGAESYGEVAERMAGALTEAADALQAGQTGVLVSHGAAMRVGICRYLGLPQQHWSAFGGFSNCSWALLEEGRLGWRVAEWNAGSLPEPVLSDDLVNSDD